MGNIIKETGQIKFEAYKFNDLRLFELSKFIYKNHNGIRQVNKNLG